MPRYVHFGRKSLGGENFNLGSNFPTPTIYHWAVQVGETWYEISEDLLGEGQVGNKRNFIENSERYAKSGAGKEGRELVGETDKSDSEINDWTQRWLLINPSYEVLGTNSQKFAYEFMDWLTDGNFICQHRFNAADVDTEPGVESFYQMNTLAVAKDGNAIARVGSNVERASYGIANVSSRTLNFQAQAVAGPGFGAWGDASLMKVEGSLGGIVGAHLEPNINTGLGVRNGNLDAHLLGFGFKVGEDGLEVNTPIGGVNACSMM